MLNFGDLVRTPSGKIGIVVKVRNQRGIQPVYYVKYSFTRGQYCFEDQLEVLMQHLGGGA